MADTSPTTDTKTTDTKPEAQKAAGKVTYAQAIKAPADIVTMPVSMNEQVRLFNNGQRQIKGVLEMLAATGDEEWGPVFKKMATEAEKLSEAFRHATMNQQAALAARTPS